MIHRLCSLKGQWHFHEFSVRCCLQPDEPPASLLVLPCLCCSGLQQGMTVVGVDKEYSRARSTENISSSDREVVERKAASLSTCVCLGSPASAPGASFGWS